jgi:hypothetical protein
VFNTKTQTKKFDTDKQEDLDEYDEILNNPLCTVTQSWKEKLTDKEFDPETGKMCSMNERLILVISWEEQVLL